MLAATARVSLSWQRFLHLLREMHSIPVVVGLLLGACNAASSSFRPIALPELVAAHPADRAITARELLLIPAEHLIWEVHLHGMTVGRVELEVNDTEVHSRFQTDTLASAVMSVHHELATVLDREHARPRSSSETFSVGGETNHYDAVFDGASYTLDGRAFSVPAGNIGQTLHTTLGLLRSWAAPDAMPGYVLVVEDGVLYRLDVARPTVEEIQGTNALRIDGRIAAKQPITFVMWVAATPDRKPLRFEIINDDLHVVADLVAN